MKAAPTRICIVGGGITGLAAAWELKTQQRLHNRVVSVRLYEAASRIGGKIQTTRRDGFIMEHGPDSFITQKPEALALCRELGLEDDLIPCNTAQQRVYVARNKNLHPLPSGFRLVAPTNISSFLRSGLFSLPGKLRALCEPFIPRKSGTDDESIADFVTRRLGREILDRAAGPMLGGIYNGDPATLGIQSTFPMLQQLEQKHGSLVRGFRKMRSQAGAIPMFMSLRDGMGSLASALENHLADICHSNCPVLSLQKQGDAWAVETRKGIEMFDAVVLTVPPSVASRLLRPLSPDTADKLDALTANSMVAVSMGFQDAQLKQPASLDGFGFLTALEPHRILTACTWSSIKFEGRAPEGHHLVRIFLSVPESDGLESGTHWLELARQTLDPYMSWSGDPVISMVTRWPGSSPQYPVHHQESVADLRRSLADYPGLFLAGSSLEGVGLPDCIRQGREAACSTL